MMIAPLRVVKAVDANRLRYLASLYALSHQETHDATKALHQARILYWAYLGRLNDIGSLHSQISEQETLDEPALKAIVDLLLPPRPLSS